MDNFNLESMNQSAKDELFRMHNRSMPHVPPFVKMPAGNNPSPKEEPEERGPVVAESPKKSGLLGADILKFLDFKNFKMDSDRMLLLLMVLILSGENSDEILMFALAYIML
mgnify:CR=1 FL=1